MSIKRTTVEERKALPLASGVLDYFPDALLVVAEVSRVGNEQHHPGEPLHWDKSKSQDEADALMRHLLDRGTLDTDGLRHSGKVAWRALAMLQRELDAEPAHVHHREIYTRRCVCGEPMTEAEILFDMVVTDTEAAIRAKMNRVTEAPMWVGAERSWLPPKIEYRGEWPPDTRVGGLLTCCGQSEHVLTCPQWR
jgi:hypothetical protein